ncbi:winged helix-turn-helix transcriptional regulator [Streptomyces sp. NPDC004111]|uniref:winged helix-turn-helix transcriptional regulator n=1 Tax=Streptomyces sp. NPDC004111 TaxID=3364690 RepID=UPI0036972B80
MTQEHRDAGQCAAAGGAVERVFALLGKRWNGVILASLMSGPGRFVELRRAVSGISERVLSDRLAELAAAGLVSREVDAGPPTRVSYQLTPAGEALRPALDELGNWAEQFLGAGEEGGCPGMREPRAMESRSG